MTLTDQDFRVRSDEALEQARRALLPLADQEGFEVEFSDGTLNLWQGFQVQPKPGECAGKAQQHRRDRQRSQPRPWSPARDGDRSVPHRPEEARWNESGGQHAVSPKDYHRVL